MDLKKEFEGATIIIVTLLQYPRTWQARKVHRTQVAGWAHQAGQAHQRSVEMTCAPHQMTRYSRGQDTSLRR